MTLEEILITRFSVQPSDIDKAIVFQQKHGGRLEKLLVNLGCLADESLVDVYAALLDKDVCLNQDFVLKKNLSGTLDLNTLLESHWAPVEADTDTFITCDPLDVNAINHIADAGIHNYQFILTPQDLFKRVARSAQESDEVYSSLSDVEEDRLRELATEAPTVNLLNSLITRALKLGASDMHVEPEGDRAKVRFRVDGVLQDVETLPPAMKLPIVSRLKILSSMDIAEKRRPQDGKIEARIANKEVDMRVSCLPLGNGESVVVRFLLKESVRYEMRKLGLSADIENNIKEDLAKTSGVILLTGPTGSGKTTSLYTFLNEINDVSNKIITLEDPIEYQLDGVNQVQVNNDINFTFAAGLRSIVRQDPDIIMVGEIRDHETARTAMQSALTGHLVFSTVHTNDAPSAFTRLLDLGVEEFLLDAAIISIMAQRLVRKLCDHCSVECPDALQHIQQYQLDKLASVNKIDNLNLRKAGGCEYCGHSGYKGRVAIMEYLRCDERLKSLPKDGSFLAKARELNASYNNRDLQQDGLLKAIQGVTTVNEVMRVAG